MFFLFFKFFYDKYHWQLKQIVYIIVYIIIIVYTIKLFLAGEFSFMKKYHDCFHGATCLAFYHVMIVYCCNSTL